MSVRTRKPAAERREEIATAALRIIGVEGLRSLNTNRLAEEVGLSSGALFRHFASLDAILLEAVRHAVRSVDRTFPDPSLPPRQRLFRLAASRVDLLGSDPGLNWLLRSDQAHLSLPEEAVDELRALIVRSRRALREAIADGIADGSLRADMHPDALLLIVTGTIHALVGLPGTHATVGDGPRTSPAEVLAVLQELLASPSTAHKTIQAPRTGGAPIPPSQPKE